MLPKRNIPFMLFTIMRPTIIIVEDDESIREVFSHIFSPVEYVLDLRSNGDELLKLTPPFPGLILLDNQLPGMNGLDICRSLKADLATAHIPVIIVSATPAIGWRSLEVAADGWLEKPFNVPVLKELVRQMIKENNH
jgi:CheY-like chemotaxis protein